MFETATGTSLEAPDMLDEATPIAGAVVGGEFYVIGGGRGDAVDV